MSGISGMNISMKNNNRRVKRKAFSNISGESDNESKGIKVEEVSEEVLIEIRQKMKRQQKVAKRKNIIVIIVTILLLPFIILLLFAYFQSDLGRIGWEP